MSCLWSGDNSSGSNSNVAEGEVMYYVADEPGEVLEEVADFVDSKCGECESDMGTYGLGWDKGSLLLLAEVLLEYKFYWGRVTVSCVAGFGIADWDSRLLELEWGIGRQTKGWSDAAVALQESCEMDLLFAGNWVSSKMTLRERKTLLVLGSRHLYPFLFTP
jgi:hypothetical protein